MKLWKNLCNTIICLMLITADLLTPLYYSAGDFDVLLQETADALSEITEAPSSSEETSTNDEETTPEVEETPEATSENTEESESTEEETTEEQTTEEQTEEDTEESSQEQEKTGESLENTEEQPSSESLEEIQEESQEDQVTSQLQEENSQENPEEKDEEENIEQNQEDNQEDNNKEENQETIPEETNNPENTENLESKEESESTTTTEEETETSGNNSENPSESISEDTKPEITEEKGNSENSTTENGEQQENKEESENAEPLDPQENTLPEENQNVEPTEEQTEEINEEHPEEQIEEQSEEPTIRSTLNQEPIIGSKKFRQVRVDVRADENTFPEGTYLRITPVFAEDLGSIQETFSEDTEIVAFDIQFLFDLEDETIELQPYTGKTVQVSFDYTQKEEFKNLNENEELQVYHIKDEEKIIEGEKIAEIAPLNTEETEQKADTLVIDAEHFSIYAIIKTNVLNDVLVHYDSGLGTFSDATTKIDVLYHATNGVYLADKTTSLPNQTGMMFQGRYTDDTCTTRRNGVTEDTKETEISVIACYLPFKEKTISLSGIELTIMDRNLGAKSPDDGGYRYQWGNNYGFEEGENGFTPAIATQMITATPSEGSTRSREKPYYSSNFISRENEPYRRDAEDNLTLWGENIDQDLQKQGPCPIGYHIPNEKERNAVYLAYFKQKKTMKGFAELLGLPLGGYRNRLAGTVTSKGSVGWYWSSKAIEGSDAYAFTFTDDTLIPQDLKSRSYANNIRCFKNNDKNLTLSFETNGGTAVESQTFKWREARTQEVMPTSTKEGRNVVGRYLDETLKTKFVRSGDSFISGDTKLYANRGCNAGYVLDANDQCVLRKVTVKYKVPNGTVNQPSSYKDYSTIIYSRNTNGQYIGATVNLAIPAFNGYMFDNWYTDTNFTKVWNYPYDTDNLGETVTVYAHFLPFKEKRIQFGDVDFVIMDRNLGAKTTSNGGTDATDDNIGYFYQFGNNYGFSNKGNLPNTNKNLMGTFSKPYANGMFVLVNGKYTSSNQAGEWGSSIGWSVENSVDSSLKGPCPNGYHLPDHFERNYYYNKFATWKNTTTGQTYCGTLGTGECFSNLLGIPFGGYRVGSSAKVTGRGTESRLWTSTHIETSATTKYTHSYYQKLTTSDRSAPTETKGNAFNLRCFKDTTSNTVTFNSMGGVQNRTRRYRVWQPYAKWTPSKAGATFINWYTTTGYTTVFDGKPKGNVTVYAKWKCNAGYTEIDNKCVYTVDSKVRVTYKANTGNNTSAKFPDGSLTKTLEYLPTTGAYYVAVEDEIQLPELAGNSFFGWYTDQNLTTKRSGLGDKTTATEITVYAKYIPFSDKTIKYGDVSVITMDRNLGATSPTGTGFWYQWGNNYGFSSATNQTQNKIKKVSSKARGPGNYLFSTSFVRIDGLRTESNYPNMRGGNGETETKANKDTDKQGPCPKGYHIPGTYEWKALYTNFINRTKTTEGKSYCSSNASNDNSKCIVMHWGLPYAGYQNRDWWNPYNNRAFYWSATPNGNAAYGFRVENNGISHSAGLNRNASMSIRCFKDSPDLTITYDTNGGSEIPSIKNFKRWIPKTNTTTIPQRAHSNFVGWFTDQNLTKQTDRNGSKYFSNSFTLYAKWECEDGYQQSEDGKKCESATVINFDAIANDGEVNRPIAGYDEGSTVDLSNFEVTKPGRTFVGWSTSQNGREPLENFEIGDTNMRLYAIFKKDLTATFQKNGNKNLTLSGENQSTFEQTCTIWNDETSCTVAIPSITPAEGFTTLGRSTGANNHTVLYDHQTELELTEDLNLYAQTKKEAIERKITFYPNGNAGLIYQGTTGTVATSYKVCTIPEVYNGASQASSCSAEIIFPTILVNGEKTIIGWTESQNSLQNPIAPKEKVELQFKSDLSFYAQSKSDGKNFTVTFYGNGTTIEGKTSIQRTCTIAEVLNGGEQSTECEVTIPTPTRKDFSILGRNTSSTATTAEIPLNQTKLSVSGDVVLYAISKKEITSTFTRNGNDAQIPKGKEKSLNDVTEKCTIWDNSETCEITTPTIISEKTPHILGYSLSGSDHTPLVSQNVSLLVSKNQTYYAQSQKDAQPLTISFYLNNNANFIYQGQKVTSGKGTYPLCTRETVYNGATQPKCSAAITFPKITAPTATPKVLGRSTDNTEYDIAYQSEETKTLSVESDLAFFAQTMIDAKTLRGSFSKGKGISKISTETQTCTISATYNGITQKTSCNVSAPTFTVTTGYENPIWQSVQDSAIFWNANEKESFSLSENTSYSITASPRTDIPYTVEHYQENANDTGYTLKETETLYGTTNEMTNARFKSYNGFLGVGFIQERISAEEQTVIQIKYQRYTYKLSFNTNGGTTLNSIDYKVGATVTAPKQNPTRTGYTFKGRNPTFPFTMPNSNKSVTANWTVNSYNLTYDLQGGRHGTTHPTSATYDQEFTVTHPTRTGYTFAGWEISGQSTPTKETKFKNLTATNGATVNFVATRTPNTDTKYTVKHQKEKIGGGYDIETENKTGTTDTKTNAKAKSYSGFSLSGTVTQANIQPDGSTVINIYYKRNEYTVSFDSDGGTAISAMKAKYEAPLTKPTNPTKVGYTFSGWNPTFPSTMPLDGVNLKAQRTPNSNTKYTVKHQKEKIGGGYDVETENKTGTTDTKTNAKAKSYAGFSLSGTVTQANIQPDGSTVVNIYYKRNEYTISFDSDGGTAISAMKAKYEALLTKPTNPSKVGYTFSGWNPTFPSIMPLDGANLKAQWTPNTNTKYTVKHQKEKIGGGYDIETENRTGTTDSKTNAKAKSYSGFSLSGTVIQANIQPDGSTVINIYYKRNEYTVSFNSDGGTAIAAIKAKYEAPLMKPTNPTKKGYTFSGWTPTFPTTMPLNGKSVKATRSPKKIHITLDPHGGTGGTSDFWYLFKDEEEKFYLDEDFTQEITEIVRPTRTGYQFVNYHGEGDHGGEEGERFVAYDDVEFSDDLNDDIYEDATLTAKWTPNTYTLKYLNTANEAETLEYQLDYDERLEIEENHFIRTGYTFSGWLNEDEEILLPGTKTEKLIPEGTYLLKTNRIPNTYTIRFLAGEGTGVMEEQTFTRDQAQNLNAVTFTKTGYDFSHWIAENGQTFKNLSSIKNLIDSGTIELLAQYEIHRTRGGGSSGGRLMKDKCPNGDYTNSYYDRKCGTPPEDDEENETDKTKKKKEEKSEKTHGSSEYSQEEIAIYEWAKELGLTSMPDIESFGGERPLKRSEMAKIVSIYLTDILKKEVIHQRQCSLFSDIKNITSDLHDYMIESCDLGIMGRTSDGQNAMEKFFPNDEVTKAEGATIISRIFWKNLYRNGKGQARYEEHLNHLVEIGAMKDAKDVESPFSRKEFYGTLKKIYTLDL